MLLIASHVHGNKVCDDLDPELANMIPVEWCEEARQLNSKGRDPWPDNPSQFSEGGLSWFLSKKLESLQSEIRDLKLSDLITESEVEEIVDKNMRLFAESYGQICYHNGVDNKRCLPDDSEFREIYMDKIKHRILKLNKDKKIYS